MEFQEAPRPRDATVTQFNPILGAALPGAMAQGQLAADKTRQLRRQQQAARKIAAVGDSFEHAVENVDAVTPVSDEKQREEGQGRRQSKKRREDPGDAPTVDVRA
ncbi:MAG TPA: hypothetical protein VF796_28795 [Humisphaera sp.]